MPLEVFPISGSISNLNHLYPCLFGCLSLEIRVFVSQARPENSRWYPLVRRLHLMGFETLHCVE